MESMKKGIAAGMASGRTPAPPPAGPVVLDVMSTSVLTFRAEQKIGDAVDMLIKRHVSGAPVVDAEHRLIGLLSEFDGLRAMTHSAYHSEDFGQDQLVGDLMSTALNWTTSDTDLRTLVTKFVADGLRRIPVVDGDLVVIGIVTRRDVLKRLREGGEL